LTDAELVLNVNEISMQGSRVSWHSHNPAAEFMTTRKHATVEQYIQWVTDGNYSAMLLDASLLQITYEVADGKITGHRLAYIPCPVAIDQALLDERMPVADIASLYAKSSDVLLQSPVRFDYAPGAAKLHHPAAHLTINSTDCRIACVAPVHVHRFVDFVFRHFYPRLWSKHESFFAEAAWRHVDGGSFDDNYRKTLHMMWDTHATASD
jgi:hypothetical protein